MATTIFPFTPSSTVQFAFQPVLDGNSYNASVPSLLFGNRYYLNLVAADGTPIIYTALIGSPTGIPIASLSWANAIVTATTETPHGYRIASTVELTIVGCTPDAYNGSVQVLITGPSTFSYLLASNPGSATVFGTANYDINLIGGVPKEDGTFFASTLVFRVPASQFEVT
jgi:hypothetical protein